MKFVVRSYLVLVLLVVAGCGDGMSTVSGAVTLDGQPLMAGPELSGTVQFVPEDGGGTPAIGYIDASGRYTLASGKRDGILPGRYLVSVAASKIIPSATPGEAAGGRPATPRKYADPKQSGLSTEVVAGSNTYDIVMMSK